MVIILLVFFPMLASFACAAVRNRAARSWLVIGTAAAELGFSVRAAFIPECSLHIGEICALGLSLELDGFRKIYALVISLMWLMTLLLSDEYLRGTHSPGRYYFFNLMTLGATMGVFLSADLFSALIFFEVMSFTSYTWVIHEETPGAVRAANTYLAVAVIGGLAALMGLFLLQHYLGTTQISELYAAGRACTHKAALYAAGGCILFGFGAKAGMFPLHIWLPKAHPVAPAPASALLSGVLTKTGIFGILAISCNLFSDDPVWGTVVLSLGTVTMLLGAVLALFSCDLKRTLACSSMSQIGFVLVGIGTMGLLGENNAVAARGTLLHMVNHSLFKLVLFMCAGVVFMNIRRLDLNEIRGFGRKKPLLNFAFLMGSLGISGVPLWNGYISKTLLHEGLVEAKTEYGWPALLVEWIFLISGGLTASYMTKLYVCVFIEKNSDDRRQAEFDSRRKYMNGVSTFALVLSAVLLPALGLTAGRSMNYIADCGTDFFRSGAAEPVRFMSWDSLKGAAISLSIGAAVYLLVVRKQMIMQNRYVDLWPGRLDLEELLYRPMLQRWLPGILGWFGALFGENRLTALLGMALLRVCTIIARVFCDALDAIVFVLCKTVYRESPVPNDDKVTASVPFRLGNRVDRVAVRRGSEQPGEHRYGKLFYRAKWTLRDTTRSITGNLSFALLMLCAAVCFVFVYMLFFH